MAWEKEKRMVDFGDSLENVWEKNKSAGCKRDLLCLSIQTCPCVRTHPVSGCLNPSKCHWKFENPHTRVKRNQRVYPKLKEAFRRWNQLKRTDNVWLTALVLKADGGVRHGRGGDRDDSGRRREEHWGVRPARVWGHLVSLRAGRHQTLPEVQRGELSTYLIHSAI